MSKDTIYVKPREGLRIRQENGRPLPAEGRHVPLNSFWRRRLRDKDVVAAQAPRKAKAKAKSTEIKEA
ncbi:DUF2635 domain-containing protein [Marinobacter sp. OP 3.4]|uniref:DUF2635 domain-containing protein n=1 Tax=Marinobacter sp. OP 3.4 TaxID=3076501 RepID=UPI002E1A754D